ncbi:hypothetical protein HUU39_14980 [candidate division KSB1 bacterium]|nr:hypothetical protein [bacterium]NUM66547.1 hypothetical protein [candidate division KSB1 bacterium]
MEYLILDGWQSVWVQLGAAGIASAALGSFIGATASAMASAYRPETAMLRGAAWREELIDSLMQIFRSASS